MSNKKLLLALFIFAAAALPFATRALSDTEFSKLYQTLLQAQLREAIPSTFTPLPTTYTAPLLTPTTVSPQYTTLTIIKEVLPAADDPKIFNFTVQGSNFSNNFQLDDNGNSALPNQKILFVPTNAGYTITEAATSDYYTNWSCASSTSGVQSGSGKSAYVNMKESETMTCTFWNMSTIPNPTLTPTISDSTTPIRTTTTVTPTFLPTELPITTQPTVSCPLVITRKNYQFTPYASCVKNLQTQLGVASDGNFGSGSCAALLQRANQLCGSAIYSGVMATLTARGAMPAAVVSPIVFSPTGTTLSPSIQSKIASPAPGLKVDLKVQGQNGFQSNPVIASPNQHLDISWTSVGAMGCGGYGNWALMGGSNGGKLWNLLSAYLPNSWNIANTSSWLPAQSYITPTSNAYTLESGGKLLITSAAITNPFMIGIQCYDSSVTKYVTDEVWIKVQ